MLPTTPTVYEQLTEEQQRLNDAYAGEWVRDGAAEVAILERFARQKHASGATPPKLLERLASLNGWARG